MVGFTILLIDKNAISCIYCIVISYAIFGIWLGGLLRFARKDVILTQVRIFGLVGDSGLRRNDGLVSRNDGGGELE